MSQSFKLKYDQTHESDTTCPSGDAEERSNAIGKGYLEIGIIRNVSFVLRDGTRFFLGYSYLVAAKYLPEENSIIISFTTATITLKGFNLEGLYFDLMDQLVKQIVAVDERYNLIGDDSCFVVNEIGLKEIRH